MDEMSNFQNETVQHQRRMQQPVEGGPGTVPSGGSKKKMWGHFLNLGHFWTYLAKFTPVTGP